MEAGDPKQSGCFHLRALTYEYARKREAEAFFEFINEAFVKDKYLPLNALDLVDYSREGIRLYFEQCGLHYLDSVVKLLKMW